MLATVLLIAPNFAKHDFGRFYRFEKFLNSYLDRNQRLSNVAGGEEEGVGDQIMVACFHPEYEYGSGEEEDKAVNFDKRAPYSIINLLRCEMVDRFIEQERTKGILERNKCTLTRIGEKKLNELYDSLNWEKTFGNDEPT